MMNKGGYFFEEVVKSVGCVKHWKGEIGALGLLKFINYEIKIFDNLLIS